MTTSARNIARCPYGSHGRQKSYGLGGFFSWLKILTAGIVLPLFCCIPANLCAQVLGDSPQDQALEPNSTAPRQETQIVLPEGFMVSGRQAHLVKHPVENRYFLAFVPLQELTAHNQVIISEPNVSDPFSRPLEVLPGKWLTNMLKFLGNQPGMSATFRIWGEITTYQNRNYILPTFAAALSIFGQNADAAADPIPASAPPRAPAILPDNQEEPMNETATSGFTGDDLVVEKNLRGILMSIPRAQPLVSAAETAANAEAEKSKNEQLITQGGASEGIWKDGYTVINREGRIYYDVEQQEWLFAFEANANSIAEPPVVILPSKMLEVMEKTTIGTGRNVKFRVTGQITKYNRRNYLLMRYVRIAHDQGNIAY